MERDFRRLEFQGRVCGIPPQGEFELPVGVRLAFTLPFHQDRDLRRITPSGRATCQLESEKRPTILKLGFIDFVDFYSKVAHPKPQKEFSLILISNESLIIVLFPNFMEWSCWYITSIFDPQWPSLSAKTRQKNHPFKVL